MISRVRGGIPAPDFFIIGVRGGQGVMPGYYEAREDLWWSIPGVEFMEGDERREASDLFMHILDDVENGHIRPQESDYWNDFIELFGFAEDGDAWDWDDFREWYDSA